MKKRFTALAFLVAVASQPASAYQQNDGTGSNGNNGGRSSFCDSTFVMPFGFVFKPCLFFG